MVLTSSQFDYQPPIDTGLDILFEDESLLAINKLSGLLSVPGKGEDRQDSLANRVQSEFPGAEVVHRLDMMTSGIMLMARGKAMQSALSKMFQQRKIKKTYIAVVDGKLEQQAGEIDLPLICDWPNRPKQKVDYDNGKPALTRYRLLQYDSGSNTSRVELQPVTGRSHQLRVHMQQLGHAIVGDRLYASEAVQAKSDRLLLHATAMVLIHPETGKELTIQSPVPF